MSNELDAYTFPTREADHTLRTTVETAVGPQLLWLKIWRPRFEDDAPFFQVIPDSYSLALGDINLPKSIKASGALVIGETKGLELCIDDYIWRNRSANDVFPGRTELFLWGIPLRFTLWSDYGVVGEDSTYQVIYSLSPNKHLDPYVGLMPELDGQRTFDHKDTLKFRLSDSCQLEFDRHYDWLTQYECKRRLVVNIVGNDEAYAGHQIEQDVEDAVLLLSLLTGIRTQISRKTIWFGSRCTETHRPRFGWPEEPTHGAFDRGVVDLVDLQRCFDAAWTAWQHIPEKTYLRNAVYALFPGRSQLGILSFLRRFAALEGLMKLHSQVRGSPAKPTQNATCLGLTELRSELGRTGLAIKFGEHLDRAIKKFSERAAKERFEEFIENRAIPVFDLWPMSSRGGLAEIRNRLIHGGDVSQVEEHAIWIAGDHLKFLLARAALRMLDLDVEKTYVGARRDKNLTMFSELENARRVIASRAASEKKAQ
jgi:hypothetical protein